MKKVLRLTESELIGLVSKVINEKKGQQRMERRLIQNDNLIFLEYGNQSDIDMAMSLFMDNSENIKFFHIRNSDGFVDFSGIDMCELPEIEFVSLKGTKNNFEELFDCYYEMGGGMYDLAKPEPPYFKDDRISNVPKPTFSMNESDLTRLVRRVINEREMDDDKPLNSIKFMFDDKVLLLKGSSSKKIQYYLSQIPNTIQFITIVNGESADFSDINICGFDNLYLVNLMNTPNNFEENVDCDFEKIGDFMYDFESDDEDDDFENDDDMFETLYEDVYGSVHSVNYEKEFLNEAEYQGRKVQLGKVMQGDVKKSKVYVKNDKGKVVKVNFGFGGTSAKGKRMSIKKNDPARRKSFRARHNCENPGPRWKPRYWSCRAW